MSNRRPNVPALSGEQSLNRYLSEIKKFPVLTAEQDEERKTTKNTKTIT